jgi:uncharacterized protein
MSSREENEMSMQLDMEKVNENRELLRQGYKAFGMGDLQAVQALFTADAVWHAQRLGRLSGDHEGWPQIAEFFKESMQLSQGSFHLEIEDVFATEDRVAVTARSKATRDGRTLDSYQVHLYRIDNGKVAEIWQFVDDQVEVSEFWA